MSRQPSKAELLAWNEQLRRSESVLSMALNAALSGPPDAEAVATDYDGGETDGSFIYKLRGWRLADAHGGIVTVTYTVSGSDQRPQTAAYYLDEYTADLRRTARLGDHMAMGILEALAEIASVRDRALRGDAEVRP